jgi:NAD(P)-dependent dehydrogenase (short-subunit alcohol dehydrogenase family)
MTQVLVAGGAGGVGEGVVRALMHEGHTVIVPSRSAAKLALLRERLGADPPDRGTLVTLVGQIGDIDGAAQIRDRITREFGRIDVAIASLGGWWEGLSLIDVSLDVWDAVMYEMLTTHFVFIRTFIPMLIRQGGGRYIGIGGGAAYFPIPKSALVCIAAAGQLMMTRALRAEVPEREVEILVLVVDSAVRTRDSEAVAEPDWITADEIGRVVVDLVAHGRTDAPSTRSNGPIIRMRPRASAEP